MRMYRRLRTTQHLLMMLILGVRWEIVIKLDPELAAIEPFSWYHRWKYIDTEFLSDLLANVRYLLTK